MILKWLANFWLRWPRCQKPSPISRAIDGHWCRSVLERWIHFALHGPMDDAQPQGFPEIPENQELLKQRQPARSGEPFMTKRPKKKHELNRVWLWNSNVFYTICGLKKVLKSFQRDSTAVSVFDHRHPIEHNFVFSNHGCCNPWDPWLIQVTRGHWSPLEWSSRLQRSKTSKRLRPWSSASGDVTKHDQYDQTLEKFRVRTRELSSLRWGYMMLYDVIWQCVKTLYPWWTWK